MTSSESSSPEQTNILYPRLIPFGYLRSGERTILEEKPNFLAYLTVGLIVWLVLGILVWLVIIAYGARTSVGWILILITFLIIPLPPLLKLYAARRRWSFAWYALTNQRIIIAGVGTSLWSTNITDYPLRVFPGFQVAGVSVYRINEVDVSQSFLGRHFGFGTIVFIAQPSSFAWIGINGPNQLRKLLEDNVVHIYEAEYVSRNVSEAFTGEVAKSYVGIHTEEAKKIASSMPGPTDYSPIPQPDQNLLGNTGLHKCPACGYINTDRLADFCSKCGHKLS